MFWVRATLPRMRVDRLMNFAWKYLVPLSILNILVAAVWYEFVVRPAGPSRLPARATDVTGWLVTLPLVAGSAASRRSPVDQPCRGPQPAAGGPTAARPAGPPIGALVASEPSTV